MLSEKCPALSCVPCKSSAVRWLRLARLRSASAPQDILACLAGSTLSPGPTWCWRAPSSLARRSRWPSRRSPATSRPSPYRRAGPCPQVSACRSDKACVALSRRDTRPMGCNALDHTIHSLCCPVARVCSGQLVDIGVLQSYMPCQITFFVLIAHRARHLRRPILCGQARCWAARRQLSPRQRMRSCLWLTGASTWRPS